VSSGTQRFIVMFPLFAIQGSLVSFLSIPPVQRGASGTLLNLTSLVLNRPGLTRIGLGSSTASPVASGGVGIYFAAL